MSTKRILTWIAVLLVAIIAVPLAVTASSNLTSIHAAATLAPPATAAPATAAPATAAPATAAPAGAAPVQPATPVQPAAPAAAATTQPAAPAANAASPSSAQIAAIKSLIEKGNQEEVQAVASGNPAVMQDTATASYYQQSVQNVDGLTSSGVTAIKLDSLKWGSITLQSATTAQATDSETWSTSFSDGSTMRETDTNVYTLVLQNGAWLIQDDQQPGNGGRPGTGAQPGNRVPPGSGVQPGTGVQPGNGTQPGTGNPSTPAVPFTPAPAQSAQDQSRNWAGYSATGGTFTSVSGTWTVPNVSAGNSAGADATWVGIGGVNSNDLIQAGTQATVQGGQVQYSAWWETLPQASQQVPLDVNAGDQVAVTITQQSDGSWLIRINDATNGQTWQSDISYSSSRSSAEWVEEAPVAGRRTLLPLDNFGQITFANGSTVENGQTRTIAQAGAQPINMDNGAGQVLAQTSVLAANGSSFTVQRTSVTAPQSAPGGRRFRRGN